MNPVLSEVATDTGLLLAGAGVGIVGTWVITVSTASREADLHVLSLPLYFGVALFIVGAVLYIIGKTAQARRPQTPAPTTVNNFNFFAGTRGLQPGTATAPELEGPKLPELADPEPTEPPVN